MFKSRSGRRRKKSYRPVESTVRRRRPRGVLGLFSVLGPILYFPMMIFYLEFFFHIYMGESLKYLPIWLLFSCVFFGQLLAGLFLVGSYAVNAQPCVALPAGPAPEGTAPGGGGPDGAGRAGRTERRGTA